LTEAAASTAVAIGAHHAADHTLANRVTERQVAVLHEAGDDQADGKRRAGLSVVKAKYRTERDCQAYRRTPRR